MYDSFLEQLAGLDLTGFSIQYPQPPSVYPTRPLGAVNCYL